MRLYIYFIYLQYLIIYYKTDGLPPVYLIIPVKSCEYAPDSV